jgi:predicted glycoside hydrolase/deacetylase ChbG (UPF0249 family)
MIKKIIINADDFGSNSSVNKAIVESFGNGLINSTTLMANMPGFDEAVELAYKHNIINKIGIHLTLTEGQPITTNMSIRLLFNDMHNSNIKRYKRNLFFLSKSGKEIIYNEFAAQILKLRNAGIKITHIDTHHHTHEIWTITQLIFSLLGSYKIPSMRILNNLNQSTSYYKGGYRKLINKIIKIKGVNNTDYLGNQLEAIWQLNHDPKFFESKRLEIMVHPDYNQSGIIIDKIKDQEVNFDYTEIFRRLIN